MNNQLTKEFLPIIYRVQNIKSPNNKLANFVINLSTIVTNYNLIVFTQTWLDNTADKEDISIKSYNLFRADRNSISNVKTRVGGVDI